MGYFVNGPDTVGLPSNTDDIWYKGMTLTEFLDKIPGVVPHTVTLVEGFNIHIEPKIEPNNTQYTISALQDVTRLIDGDGISISGEPFIDEETGDTKVTYTVSLNPEFADDSPFKDWLDDTYMAKGSVSWNDLLDVPDTFPPTSHNHNQLNYKYGSNSYISNAFHVATANDGAYIKLSYYDAEDSESRTEIRFNHAVNIEPEIRKYTQGQYTDWYSFITSENIGSQSVNTALYSSWADLAYRSYTADSAGSVAWGNISGKPSVITSENIGSQSVNYANSAGSVAWGNISGKPSFNYLPLTGGTVTGTLNIGANSRVRLWEDSEGGNIEIASPDGKCTVQADMPYGDGSLRVYMWNTNYPGAEYRGDFRWYGDILDVGCVPRMTDIVVRNWIFSSNSRSANHGILLGTDGRDECVFYEYGGTWSFVQHQNGSGWYMAIIKPDGLHLGSSQKQDAWFRSYGNTGWYNQTYNGGWYMTDSTWIRAYNGKAVYSSNSMRAYDFQAETGCRFEGGWCDWYYGGSNLLNVYTNTGDNSAWIRANASTLHLQSPSFILVRTNNHLGVVNTQNNAYKPVYASAFTVNSSKLVKENFKSITNNEALKLLKLNVVSFDYKQNFGGQKGQYGLIAEEVLDIIPSCVQVPEGYDESNFDESKGIMQPILSLDYSKLVPHLIKMMQIQQKEINELKEQIGGQNYA